MTVFRDIKLLDAGPASEHSRYAAGIPHLVPMSSLDEEVTYYLARLRDGVGEDAFFGLIEAGPGAVPMLIAAFAIPENRAVRADLVRCVWEYRQPEALGFLAGALYDPEPAVWKTALDGIVTLGGSEAVRTLEAAHASLPADQPRNGITAEWINEALDQLREQAAEDTGRA